MMKSQKIDEGPHLDYKKALSGKNPENQYREFLKDVSAFANSGGGDILLGVSEPNDSVGTSDQIIGIDNASEVIDKLERVAGNSLDPRIAGLIIVPVKVSNREVIIIHIPPSTNRPHMVNHGKTMMFYFRHNKSSIPMNTQDLRRTIIETHTYAELIEKRLDSKRDALRKYYTKKEQPAFIIQAIPAAQLPEKWETSQEELKNVLAKGSRGKRAHAFNLAPYSRPELGMDDVHVAMVRKGDSIPYWRTEICNDGQISVVYNVQKVRWNSHTQQEDPEFDNLDRYLIHDLLYDFIRAFCDIVQTCKDTTKTELPFVFACTLFSAHKASHEISDFEEPRYQDLEILEWDQEFVTSEERCDSAAERIIIKLRHAFNLE